MKFDCPLPFNDNEKINLAHGGGGRRMARLIQEIILPHFPDCDVENIHDGAILEFGSERLAFTTDSFVVTPQFFPGGNIGDLAINGTLNDLAMCGAQPLYLSCAFILEEGYSMESFRQVLVSMGDAATSAGVGLITGDTKVVDHGKGDGIFITTTGIGHVMPGAMIDPRRVQSGDVVIINGPVGDHGMAIMCQRENLAIQGELASDTRTLHEETAAIINQFGEDIHCLRDMTRGGLATVMNEIAQTANATIHLDEGSIPVNAPTKSACELLGIDPLYVANEGKLAIFAAAGIGEDILETLRKTNRLNRPVIIGRVGNLEGPRVILRGVLGGSRILDLLSGEQLPRIC
ncbi:MAG: hydrogenase expression/formation protein HypE [Fidelibacterota bacterium]|nr:MAG: hydrogenase expression/formation protein HypE [Candidatus Neomarinimicrobiota bacterium]